MRTIEQIEAEIAESEITERQQAEAALQKEQEFLKVLLDNVQAGIVACNAEGILTLFNRAAREFHGLPEQPLPPEQWAQYYDLYLPDGKTRMKKEEIPLFRALHEQRIHNVEMMIVPKQGTPRTLLASGQEIVDAQGRKHGAVVVMHDITARKQAEAERVQLIQEQAARLEAQADQQRSAFLVEVSTVLASSLDYESTLSSVANLVVPYFADWCSVNILEDNQSIRLVAVAHQDPEKVKLGWELYQRYPYSLDVAEGVPKVLRTRQAEIAAEIPDAAMVATAQDAEHLQILRELGLKSCIVTPLVARGRILGAISFVTAESGRRYSAADLSLAEDVAHRAAIAIDNARLYREAQQAAERTARLQSVTAALSESLTPTQVSEVIVEQGMAALSANSALVALLNESGTELEIVRAVGYEVELVDAWHRFPIDTPVPLAEAVRTGQPIWAESTQTRVARYPHLTEMYAQYNFDAWISIPLMVEGRAVGGMSLGFAESHQINQDDQAFILALAQQCAQAIARAHLYEAERKARAASEAANRIKDEFLAVLSHELRTPLNPILGWAKLLRSGNLDQKKTDLALETIERNAKLQAQLIEDLLDISRILQGKLRLNANGVNLSAIIAAAIETVRLSAEAKSIQIQSIIAPNIGQVFGDSNRLQQVVWNLLSNAVKFSRPEGRVEVHLEHLGTHAQIRVSDTGKGISPDFLPHVFESFRQADGTTTRMFGGLGLGLSIARYLVELHGGTIQAQSAGEGQGATFTVRFPLMTSYPKQEPNTTLAEHVDLNGKRSVGY